MALEWAWANLRWVNKSSEVGMGLEWAQANLRWVNKSIEVGMGQLKVGE